MNMILVLQIREAVLTDSKKKKQISRLRLERIIVKTSQLP